MNQDRGITAQDVVAMLRAHYLPDGKEPAGLFADEVGSPCGKRRADALWLPTTVAGGIGLVGHEVKVSRADVVIELADPAKSEPWAKYCDRWWLVVSDPRLIDGLDVPEAWGVMAPPSGRLKRSMTILRPAPKLNPADPSPGLRRLIAWQMYGLGERVARAEADIRSRDREIASLQRRLEERAALASGVYVSEWTKRLGTIVRRAEERMESERLWDGIDDETIVEAIVDAMATRHAAAAVRWALQNVLTDVEALAKPVRIAGDDLAKAIRLGIARCEDPTTTEGQHE